MADNNNIDKLFKDKLGNRQFDFNPSAWEAAEQLIIAQEKKKRRAVWWWFSGAAASLLLLIGGWLMFQDYDKVLYEPKDVEVTEEIVSTNKSTTEGETTTKAIPAIEMEDIPSSNSENIETDISEPNIKNVNKHTKAKVKPQPIEKVLEPDEEAVAKKANTSNKTARDIDEEMEKDWNEMSNREKRLFKKELRKEEKLALMEYKNTMLFDTEEANMEAKPLDIMRDRLNWLRKININLIGGISASQGFLNSDLTRSKIAFDPTVGLGTFIIINSQVSIDINALYTRRGALSADQLPSSYVINGTTEVAKKLHYIDIPFYINYRFANRHSLRFGLQYAQLMGVTSEVVEAGDTKPVSTYKKQPYFSKNDVAGIVGYKYLVNERFNVGVRANFGLFDVTKGQKAGENTFDMNRQARFLIEYKILKY